MTKTSLWTLISKLPFIWLLIYHLVTVWRLLKSFFDDTSSKKIVIQKSKMTTEDGKFLSHFFILFFNINWNVRWIWSIIIIHSFLLSSLILRPTEMSSANFHRQGKSIVFPLSSLSSPVLLAIELSYHAYSEFASNFQKEFFYQNLIKFPSIFLNHSFFVLACFHFSWTYSLWSLFLLHDIHFDQQMHEKSGYRHPSRHPNKSCGTLPGVTNP
jgi:hypothetical protein